MKAEYVWTSDDMRLMGVHYPGTESCVLMIHGMAGNIMEHVFGNVLGERVNENGFGFIYAHTRGYNHINEIATKPKKKNNGYNYTVVGTSYELFEDSLKDIEAWVEKVRELGYKKIILLGHSLGCNKVIYYLYTQKSNDVTGVILLSPPDMVGLVEKREYEPNHKALLHEAREFMKAGKSRSLLSKKVWSEFGLSAQTYLSFFEKGRPVDNLPVLRNPEKFEQLEAISKPILCVVGEYDDIAIQELSEDMKLIKSKATNCPNFQSTSIDGANHIYENRENRLADAVVEWLNTATKPTTRGK